MSGFQLFQQFLDQTPPRRRGGRRWRCILPRSRILLATLTRVRAGISSSPGNFMIKPVVVVGSGRSPVGGKAPQYFSGDSGGVGDICHGWVSCQSGRVIHRAIAAIALAWNGLIHQFVFDGIASQVRIVSEVEFFQQARPINTDGFGA